MSAPAKTAQPLLRPGERFGREIRAALADGASPDDFTLRLTLMDASKIKRDPLIPLTDVSFAPDGMRYLGVRVVEGNVRSSELMEGAPPEPVVEEPVVKAKPKPRAKAKPKVVAEADAPAA